MNLKHLTDKVLLDDTKKLAKAEREVTIKILHHLKEIDRRKLFTDLGHRSLHDYCLRELGYSDASAHLSPTSIIRGKNLFSFGIIKEKNEFNSMFKVKKMLQK